MDIKYHIKRVGAIRTTMGSLFCSYDHKLNVNGKEMSIEEMLSQHYRVFETPEFMLEQIKGYRPIIKNIEEIHHCLVVEIITNKPEIPILVNNFIVQQN